LRNQLLTAIVVVGNDLYAAIKREVVGVAAESLTHSTGDTPSKPRLETVNALAVQLAKLIRQATHRPPWPGCPSMDKASFVLVAALVSRGPQRTGALAEAVHSDPSTISRQVAALVKQGLVERRPDQHDGRACVLAVTDRGERVFDSFQRTRDEHMARMLATWPDDDLLRLIDLLERFNTDFDDYRPEPNGVTAMTLQAMTSQETTSQEGDNR
jgi:DNA-binding MarR family transcriptional regulator